MIISHKYKIIFIHIPKNAGSFITQFLNNLDKNLDAIVGPMMTISVKNFNTVKKHFLCIKGLYSWLTTAHTVSYPCCV